MTNESRANLTRVMSPALICLTSEVARRQPLDNAHGEEMILTILKKACALIYVPRAVTPVGSRRTRTRVEGRSSQRAYIKWSLSYR